MRKGMGKGSKGGKTCILDTGTSSFGLITIPLVLEYAVELDERERFLVAK